VEKKSRRGVGSWNWSGGRWSGIAVEISRRKPWGEIGEDE
jgi:hypothetical protein